MKQEEYDSIVRYLDHTIDNDRRIYRQVMEKREFEAEMIEKAIMITNEFIREDLVFTGTQVKDLLKHIFNVPFEK